MAETDKQLLLIHPAQETKQLVLSRIHNKKKWSSFLLIFMSIISQCLKPV